MSKCECKECLHYDVCYDRIEFGETHDFKGKNGDCDHYKSKSLFVELPCRCAECEHLTVINSDKIYAKCEKTGLEFLPFGIDTREHYCSLGKLKEWGEVGE